MALLVMMISIALFSLRLPQKAMQFYIPKVSTAFRGKSRRKSYRKITSGKAFIVPASCTVIIGTIAFMALSRKTMNGIFR